MMVLDRPHGRFEACETGFHARETRFQWLEDARRPVLDVLKTSIDGLETRDRRPEGRTGGASVSLTLTAGATTLAVFRDKFAERRLIPPGTMPDRKNRRMRPDQAGQACLEGSTWEPGSAAPAPGKRDAA